MGWSKLRSCWAIWVVLTLSAFTTSCVSLYPNGHYVSGPGDGLDKVDILYGTDRASVGAAGQYSDRRAGKLNLGQARVTIPPNHTPGLVERPFSFISITLSADRSKHLMLAGTPTALTQSQFLSRARSQADRGALLFVHGYNTDFEGGLYRTAQLAYDLNFENYAFHYSWPSRGNVVSYDYDDQSERQARKYFIEYLQLIVRQAGVRNLTIIAHSKGNDLVLSALTEVAGGADVLKSGALEELILASPDVDRDLARQMLMNLTSGFAGVTLYANNNDGPLEISRRKAGGIPRAGQLMEDGLPLVIRGVDSIDATAAKVDWKGLNHNAYAFDDRLRADLQGLARGKRPPDHRTPFLEKVGSGAKVFWRLLP